jgi:hypothetical protein
VGFHFAATGGWSCKATLAGGFDRVRQETDYSLGYITWGVISHRTGSGSASPPSISLDINIELGLTDMATPGVAPTKIA